MLVGQLRRRAWSRATELARRQARTPSTDAGHARRTAADRRGQASRPRPPDLQGDAVVSTVARGRAARPPRRADRLRPPAARARPRARARRSATATSRPCSPGSPRSRPRWSAAAALEHDRARLLSAPAPRSASRHHRHARALCALITPGAAEPREQRSAELRGLLAEIAREHGINRALMRQELAFLVAPDPPARPGARAGLQPARAAPTPAPPAAPTAYRALDLQA